MQTLLQRGLTVCAPQSKMLACGDVGVGGMGEVGDIVEEVLKKVEWYHKGLRK